MSLLHEETEGERAAVRFLSHLASCPLDEWRRAVDGAERDRSAADGVDDCAQLAVRVAAPEMTLVAWHLRDMISTCMHRFQRAGVVLSPPQIRSITAETERTVEALLVRDLLPRDTVMRLLRPFERLVGQTEPY